MKPTEITVDEIIDRAVTLKTSEEKISKFVKMKPFFLATVLGCAVHAFIFFQQGTFFLSAFLIAIAVGAFYAFSTGRSAERMANHMTFMGMLAVAEGVLLQRVSVDIFDNKIKLPENSSVPPKEILVASKNEALNAIAAYMKSKVNEELYKDPV